jgi:hypothetical protein
MWTTAKLLDAVSSALCLFVKSCMVFVIGLWPDAVRENSEEIRERERGERYIERETHTHTHTHIQA